MVAAEGRLLERGGAAEAAPQRVGVEGGEADHCRCREVSHGAEQGAFAQGVQFDAPEQFRVVALQFDLAESVVREAESVVGHGGVCRSEAAHAHRFQSARPAVVAQVDAGHAEQGIGHGGDALPSEVGGVEPLHGGGGAECGRPSRCSYLRRAEGVGQGGAGQGEAGHGHGLGRPQADANEHTPAHGGAQEKLHAKDG